MKRIIYICISVIMVFSLMMGCEKSPNQEPVENQVSKGEGLTSFETVDSKGEKVTQDIFKENDITMVNIWATWCGACVDEMGELQKLHGMLKDVPGANMITICEDMDSQGELAKKILKGTNAEFRTLAASQSMRTNYLNTVQAFPTTIFVDKEGKIVGEAFEGAPAGDIAEYYMDLIKERLSKVEKQEK